MISAFVCTNAKAGFLINWAHIVKLGFTRVLLIVLFLVLKHKKRVHNRNASLRLLTSIHNLNKEK